MTKTERADRAELAVGTLQTALRQYQQSFALCEVHTPDLWEGDGTCVLCEAVHQHDQLTALQTALHQLVLQWRARADEWEIVWSAAPGLEDDLLPSGAYRKAADELEALLPALEPTP